MNVLTFFENCMLWFFARILCNCSHCLSKDMASWSCQGYTNEIMKLMRTDNPPFLFERSHCSWTHLKLTCSPPASHRLNQRPQPWSPVMSLTLPTWAATGSGAGAPALAFTKKRRSMAAFSAWHIELFGCGWVASMCQRTCSVPTCRKLDRAYFHAHRALGHKVTWTKKQM